MNTCTTRLLFAKRTLTREKISNDVMQELEAKEDEWAFLYEDDDDEMPNGTLFPSQQKQLLAGVDRPRPAQPVISQPRPGRNDKVSVRYPDGTVMKDVKYKKVEADVETRKCELL